MRHQNFQRMALFFSLVLGFQPVFSQDFTLSQFNTVSHVFNPACIGTGPQEGRAVATYRNQWFASGFPYQTFLFSAEYKKNFLPKVLKQMAYSFAFADDQIGDGQWRNTWVSLGTSASKSLDDARRHTFSFGISSSLLIRQFNARNLIFENQFESSSFTFNQEIASGENAGPVRQGFFQINSGVLYHFAVSDRFSFGVGGSGLWLYRPNEQLSNLTVSSTAKMNSRLTANFSSAYALSSDFAIEPQVFFSQQGKAREVNLGAWLVFSSHLYRGGVWQTAFGLFNRLGDSFIPAIRLGNGKMYGQLSYDATLSSAKQTDVGKTFVGVGGMGAIEFSLVYGFNLRPAALKRFIIPCQTF